MENLAEKAKKYLMNTYYFGDIVIDYGKGVYLFDKNGKKYLDFVSGIAVNSLGYAYPKFVEALKNQIDKFNHCSNIYFNLPQINLSEMLVKNSDFDRVFFCNSGAESTESALKLIRKYGKTKSKDCTQIISMKNSFHGRTCGSITLTGQEKYQKGLEPLLSDILYADYNDFNSVLNLVSEKTAGIILEPIQGEGGVIPAEKEFLSKVRELCTEKNIVLAFDEVQTGIGRTGELFGYQVHGIVPDVICLAKGLGNGIPIGCMMAKEHIASAFNPGDHASTFGGNPIATTAGKVVLEELLQNNLLENVKKQSVYLKSKLEELKNKYSFIKEIRGEGLLLGIALDIEAKGIIANCRENNLLLIGAGTNVIRLVPPLVIKENHVDEAINILDEAFKEI